jgi:hypothetical protein
VRNADRSTPAIFIWTEIHIRRQSALSSNTPKKGYICRPFYLRAFIVCLSAVFNNDVRISGKKIMASRHQKAGQDRDIKTANRSFENVAQFKYLGTTVTKQNLIQEQIKRRLRSGNACYHQFTAF